jgi:histidine ammonia-lyase
MEINHNWLKIEDIERLITSKDEVYLSETAIENISKCRNYLDNKLSSVNEPIYGINTGFGSLCNTKINNNQLEQLQENLVMSHACGTGEELPQEIVKLMLLLKAKGLAKGYSAAKVETVERLLYFYNKNIIPVVYTQGSLGASGDLAPLAHLSLPLIGKGEVYYNGVKMPTLEALKAEGLNPIKLSSKEGLALLNGTQFMSSVGVWMIIQLKKMVTFSEKVAAMSLDAFDARIEPFDVLIHKARPYNGQYLTAMNIRKFLAGSEIISQPKQHVQDPYSFRCIPQVIGACRDAIDYVEKVLETEINSVTDNPTVFPDDDKIISGGNFHGQPLAMAFDYLALAIAEIGNIAERRVYKLISGQRGLPPFLVANPGLNSGFMIPQYTAASIVSQNKQLATPCSIDTIDSSNGQEDHVSMGANAATRLLRMFENLKRLVAIELLNAAQALDFRKPLKSSEEIEVLKQNFRTFVPFISNDVEMHIQIAKSVEFIDKEYRKIPLKIN